MNADIWENYAQTKDKALKDVLILEYAPLVKHLAGKIGVHIGYRVEQEDLVSYGIFGLIDAIDKFDYKKGVKFETYANLRIRGAIIDSIRKLDWIPREIRQKNKLLENTYAELEESLGREPFEEEIAAKLEISLEETKDLIKKASLVSLISLDDYLERGSEENIPADTHSPEEIYDKKEVGEILASAIDTLKENEKKVITLYYFEDLTLKEISKVIEVSESRVSQIHSKAVMKLRAKLGRYKHLIPL